MIMTRRDRDPKVPAGNGQNDSGAMETKPSQRRRKLVKGALTAPAILTLYNGAALARTSNVVTVAETIKEATIGPGDGTTHPADYGKAVCALNCAHPEAGERCDLGEYPELRILEPEEFDQYLAAELESRGYGQLSPIQKLLEQPNQCNGGVLITASSATSLFV
jgi:hypothetical protein